MNNFTCNYPEIMHSVMWLGTADQNALLQQSIVCFLKMGQSWPLFVYFCYFLDTISIIEIEKSVDGVLGIQTRGRRMVGIDETAELWRPLSLFYPYSYTYTQTLHPTILLTRTLHLHIFWGTIFLPTSSIDTPSYLGLFFSIICYFLHSFPFLLLHPLPPKPYL